MFFLRKNKKFASVFKKNRSYIIGDIKLLENSCLEKNDLTDLDCKSLSWDAFKDLFFKEVVVILVNPPDDNKSINDYLEVARKDLGSIKMRIILISNDPKWRNIGILHYLYVLPLATKCEEIKRLYFQLSSYFTSKYSFYLLSL